MSSTEFNYEGSIINIQCNPEEKMEEILQRFAAKVGKNKEELYFIYGGGIVKEELTFSNQVNKSDKERNKMSILVNIKTEEERKEEESLKKSQYIICPVCKESARILIDKYKIGIYSCINGHKTDNILFSDFEQTQNYDEAKILCQDCKKVNKSTSYNNTFFICFDCKQQLCQLCKSIHNKAHNIINYEDKFFTCDSHYEPYNSYCTECLKDICTICEMEHSGHKIITYGSILPNIKKIKEEKEEFNNRKEALKEDIREIVNKLNKLIYIIDDYYGIYEDVLNSYGNKKRNYFLLQNIHDINKFNKDFIQNMNKILQEKNIFNKIKNIIDIYKDSTEADNNKEEKDTIKDNKIISKEIINNKEESKKEINKEKQTIKEIEVLNETLMIESENKEDTNYKDFDITKIKKILSLHLFKKKIFILKDGRFINYDGEDYKSCFVFDLKNKTVFDLNIKKIYDILQIDDDLYITITDSGISLVKINKDNIQIIKTLTVMLLGGSYCWFKLIKVTNDKILLQHFSQLDFQTIIYENKDIKFLDDKRRLKSTEDDIFEFYFYKICLINQNEIAINYKQSGIFGDTNYISIVDIEKDKKIQTFKVDSNEAPFVLINEGLFLYANKNKIYPFNLKTQRKKKEFKLPYYYDIKSILPLNKKIFIVLQKKVLHQFELDTDNNFKLIHSYEHRYNYGLLKYPKNRILIYRGKYDDRTENYDLFC